MIALKKGDESAYNHLYDNYSGALYGFILQVVPEKEQAKDILQEVFMKIFQRIEQYDDQRGRLYTWMVQIARNTAIDKVRSKSYRTARQVQSLEDQKENSGGSVIPNMDYVGVDKALFSLDETHKRIIDLAYFQGFTQNEIADELELPLGTVKTRVRNALIQLRKLLNIVSS